MASTSQRKRGRDDDGSTLDADIRVLNRAMDACHLQPARDAFDSASALLTTIRVRFLLFTSVERASTSSSCRTLRLTNRITWTLGGLVLMYAKRLSEACKGDGQTDSARQC
jgi:hypothetical protein